ncbi:MAG: DUF4426 domain-containing protein [Halieaceae bacterium]|jgi:hypothetical protein
MAQPFRHQRGLPYLPVWTVALCLLLSLGIHSAHAQQSTQYDEFELHHSIVYTTFVAPEVAAEYGITRGADKAMLTLSVRDAASGDMAGRPMEISGRSWDLITGGELDVREIREGRATYYIVPFEFLDREYRFFEFSFRPEGSEKVYEHKMKVQLWRQD